MLPIRCNVPTEARLVPKNKISRYSKDRFRRALSRGQILPTIFLTPPVFRAFRQAAVFAARQHLPTALPRKGGSSGRCGESILFPFADGGPASGPGAPQRTTERRPRAVPGRRRQRRAGGTCRLALRASAYCRAMHNPLVQENMETWLIEKISVQQQESGSPPSDSERHGCKRKKARCMSLSERSERDGSRPLGAALKHCQPPQPGMARTGNREHARIACRKKFCAHSRRHKTP